MATSERMPAVGRWQFGLRDLLGACVWASLVFWSIGQLARGDGMTALGCLVFSAPLAIFATIIVTTRYRTILEGTIGSFALVFFFYSLPHARWSDSSASDAALTVLIVGGFGGATAASIGAFVRGYRFIGILAFVPMAVYWFMLLAG